MKWTDLSPVRTLATILYTDIAGFTSTAESMSPETVFGTLNEYFPAVIKPIQGYSGVVNQFQGDAMLASPLVYCQQVEAVLPTACHCQ